MAQAKIPAGATPEMPCSVVAEMFTNGSKMHLGSILVNSAVRHNCRTIRKVYLIVLKMDESSR